jgi:membrane protein implicated in regulation of membrane protease activity
MILLYLDVEIFFRETLDYSYLNAQYLGVEVSFKSSSFTCRVPGRTRATIAAGIILLWRFAAARATSEDAERRAQKLIGVSFYVIAAYVGFEAVRSLLTGEHPEASWAGIGLAAVTLVTMPPLAFAKSRIGEKLGSSATKSEGQQNMLCAYLSAALLVGLGANALFGLWWADPVTALLIAGVAVREGRESWRGESCCTAPVVAEEGCCDDDCCSPPDG